MADSPGQPPPPSPGAPPPYGSPHPMAAANVQEWERTYAMFIHLTILAIHVVPVPVVPALVMWLIKKDESPFINDHGKEAVNFQISLLLYGLASFLLMFICVGWVAAVAAYVLGIVGMILAAIAAHGGRYYRYPACLRLIP